MIPRDWFPVLLILVAVLGPHLARWPQLDTDRRRFVATNTLLMVGSWAASWFSTFLPTFFPGRDWPKPVAVAWAVWFLGLMFIGFVGFARLIDLPVWPQKVSPEDTRSPMIRESSLADRIEAGIAVVLRRAGWIGLVFILLGYQQGRTTDGVMLALYWIVILTVSGSAGGIAFYLTDSWRKASRLGIVAANVITLLVYSAVAGGLVFALTLFIEDPLF